MLIQKANIILFISYCSSKRITYSKLIFTLYHSLKSLNVYLCIYIQIPMILLQKHYFHKLLCILVYISFCLIVIIFKILEYCHNLQESVSSYCHKLLSYCHKLLCIYAFWFTSLSLSL